MTEKISFQFSIDLDGLEVALKDPRQIYEENISQLLFFRETSFPWSYGRENLIEIILFLFSIDLDGLELLQNQQMMF